MTGPFNPGAGRALSLGEALAMGLAQGTNSFIQTNNTFEQQRQQQANILADQQFRQQQADEQQRQWELAQAAQAARDLELKRQFDLNYQRVTGLDKAQEDKDSASWRDGQLRNVLAPQVSAFMTTLDQDKQRYAPTLPDGRANPMYDPAMYEATTARRNQLMKMWVDLGKSTGSGDGWDEKWDAVTSFMGVKPAAQPQAPSGAEPAATVPGLPAVPVTAPAVASLPPSLQPSSSTQPPAPSSAQPLGSTPPASGAPAPQPTAAPAASQSLPSRVQDIPASRLTTMSDDELLARYGQGGVEYARAARYQYQSAQEAAAASAAKVRLEGWQTQLAELSKRDDLTGPQRIAMTVITTLMAKPTLTSEDATQLTDAFNLLTPALYTPETWQKVLDTKDPAVILAQYPLYQKHAPQLVAGFDITPIYTTMQSDLDAVAAKAAVDYAAAGKLGAETTEIQTLLPGKVRAQDDEHDESVADQGKTEAETDLIVLQGGETVAKTGLIDAQTGLVRAQTDETVARTANIEGDTTNDALDARKKAYDLGVSTLATLAGSGATVYQIQTADPDTWARLKRDLGMNDATLTAALQLARYEYGKDDDLERLTIRLKGSELLTDGARRAGIIAETARTVQTTANEGAIAPLQRANLAAETADIHSRMVARNAELQPRLNLLNAQIRTELAQGRNVDSLIRERDTLLPVRVGEGTARTANLWAQVANLRSTVVARDAKLQPELNYLNAQIAKAQAEGRNVDSLIRRRDALLPYEVSAAAQDLKDDRLRTAAYVKGVEGQYAVNMARVGEITAKTALARAKDPNDPLYNPQLATAKPSDPLGILQKKAGLFYIQADNALKSADKLQTQINGLVKLGTGVTGTFDMSRLSADDQKKLGALTRQRDHLFKQAQGYRQKGDDVITEGMATQATSGPNAGQTLRTVGNANLSGLTPTLVTRVNNMVSNFKAPGGLIPVVNQGVRTYEEQAALYAKGRTAPGPIVTYAKPGQGTHESGNSLDISWMDPKTGRVVSEKDPRAQAAWKALGALAPQYGLIWGGTFKAPNGKPFVDMYHFEVSPGAAPTTSPVATAAPKATPQPAPTATPGKLPPPPRNISGVGLPKGLIPVGAVLPVAKRITTASWVQAQGIQSADLAKQWLDRTVNGLLPKGTTAQKTKLRTDLATTLGW